MTPQDQQQGSLQSVGGDAVREQDKIHLVLSYAWILCLIPLLTVKDSPFVQWHAKQGLVLSIAIFFIGLINVVPVLGWLLYCVAVLGWAVASIMGIVNALKGQRWRIPLVADLAERF